MGEGGRREGGGRERGREEGGGRDRGREENRFICIYSFLKIFLHLYTAAIKDYNEKVDTKFIFNDNKIQNGMLGHSCIYYSDVEQAL